MDKIDREILETMRKNSRISYTELGQKVFLSANTVSERVRRMQESGIILAFETRLDLRAMGLALIAIIDVKLSPGVAAVDFEAHIQDIPGIIEATLMTGSFDYMLRVACRDQDALVRLTELLRARGGVLESYTRVLLRSAQLRNRLA
ncbi:MAG: Lrp/AsnC family transcriptional regulator [Pseudomonadota bacterium]